MTTLTLKGADIPQKATDTPRAATATMRDPRLDFYRGLAMFIILIAHTPGNFLTRWIPARWGFSDATEIFVFCSGMASAIAFGKVFADRSWALGTARVAFRVWQVYWAHIGLFFAIAGIMACIDSTDLFEKSYIGSLNLWPFFKNTPDQLIGLLTLTYVPNYFDILPMYLVILAMMPVVTGLYRFTPFAAAGFVIAVWMLAQVKVQQAWGISGVGLSLPAESWSARQWFFNPFGWQLVFFTGFAFMRGWIPAPPVRMWLIILAAIVVVANIPLSNIGVREFDFGWARAWRQEHSMWFNKTGFGLLRYVHFLALAYLGWVIAGPQGDRLKAHGTTVFANVWRVLLTMILKVGQQSLAVFVFSMVAARLIGFAFDQLGREPLTVWLGNLIGFALIIAVAYIAGWFKSHPWRTRKP